MLFLRRVLERPHPLNHVYYYLSRREQDMSSVDYVHQMVCTSDNCVIELSSLACSTFNPLITANILLL